MNKKPNVIWILTDQQRSETLSINGSENSTTPNLDTLAKTGANFCNAVSGFPLCCPYRGSMLTGVYPHNCVPGHECQMPPEMPTVATTFNENGYDTFYLGKWHLDGAKEAVERAGTHFVPPERRGHFKSWLGYENNNTQYDCYLHGNMGDKEVDMFRLEKYETDAMTDIMLDYLDKKSEDQEPFFAVMSVQPPHDLYVAPPENQKNHTPAGIKLRPNVPAVEHIEKKARYELSGYYAMVENVDENVGRIVNKLKESGLYDNTHIIFFSDHGDMHGSHGQFRKTTPYEEAIRVPFIISGENLGAWYCNRRVGNVENVLINHVDVAPTSLGLCDIEVPDWMQGTDYSAIRKTTGRKENDPEANYPNSAYLQLVIPTKHGDSVNKPWRGVVTTDGYKYVCFENCDWLLYDLNTDPYEQVNLAHNEMYKGLRDRLKAEVQRYIDTTGDKFQLPE